MSSHFNYDIDEKNLRLKLKELKHPYKEEAWRKFEAYSEASKANSKTRSLPDFQLNLNRNILMPVIFGAIIILFSVLLFNFVNIDTKNQEPAANLTEKPAPMPETQEKIVPVINVDSMTAEKEKADTTLLVKDSVSTVITPSPAPTPTIAEEVIVSKWTSIESGDIYVDPNIRSSVIGSAPKNKVYNALEEKNYFIKISFEKNGKSEFGYIRKQFLVKGEGNEIKSENNQTKNSTPRKKARKAEVLESIQAPSLFPGKSEEKEPELK